MKRIIVIAVSSAFYLYASIASAQVAGRIPLGVATAEMDTIVAGWSARKNLLNKNVVNDQNQKVGEIEDIIITPEKSVSYAIIGTGGFLGIARHDVAIPIEQLRVRGDQLMLPGATKDALKKLPPFEYARK